MTTTTYDSLTDGCKGLFCDLVEDAPNWSGQPLFDGDKADCGRLAHLKRAGLVTTFEDEGCTFVIFTPAGITTAIRVCGQDPTG